MLVDQNLADISDLAFRSAFCVYFLALILSVLHYDRKYVLSSLRSARAEQLRELSQDNDAAPALVGQDSASAPKNTATSNAQHNASANAAQETTSQDATTTPTTEEALPEKLRADAILQRAARVERIGGIAHALVWLGLAVHLVHSITRGLANHRFPWGNLFEYVMTITLFTVMISAFIISRKSMRVFWPWLLAPVLALMFYAGKDLYTVSGPVSPALKSYWLSIHVSTVSIGGSIGLISGVLSVMYLLRRMRENKHDGKSVNKDTTKRSLWDALVEPLPSAEKLDALAYRTAVWALPIFGLGVIFGAIWADRAWGRFWGWDPKETVSLITWILYAAYLHARATPGWRDRAVWINIAAFAAMVFNLFFVNLVVSGLHSYAGLS